MYLLSYKHWATSHGEAVIPLAVSRDPEALVECDAIRAFYQTMGRYYPAVLGSRLDIGPWRSAGRDRTVSAHLLHVDAKGDTLKVWGSFTIGPIPEF